MSTNPRRSDAAPRRWSAPDPARRVALKVRKTATTTLVPGILDAVRDQHGGRWIRYGTRQDAIWFAVADLISDASTVFRRLSSVGVTCLTPATQSALKGKIEAYNNFRPALVATRPGWLEGFYLFGDGTRATPRFDAREVIIAFEPHSKFAPRGTLADWKAGVAPFVAGQPLPYFALGLAFSGALLRFAPRGYLNPQVELVGHQEVGKSSLGVLAASVWAGNPDSDCGGGESWDMTVNSLDPVKLIHGDGFLFLDEANLAGASAKDRREFARQATFKVAATGGKRRWGDSAQGEHTRLAMLSTTNTPLADLIEGSDEERAAVQSRRITIPIARHGVFDFLPQGYDSARAASEAMVAVSDVCWGTAGRAFVEHLVRAVERDEELVRRVIARGLASYMRQDHAPTGSARVQKTFALVAVATALARRWGVLPAAWGSPLRLVQEVARISSGIKAPKEVDPLAGILAYVERHRASMIEVGKLVRPLPKAEFESTAGFLRQGSDGEEVLIPAGQFQAAFPDHQATMRPLRASGQAQTEVGQNSKLTIKTPRAICSESRVYCIRLRASRT